MSRGTLLAGLLLAGCVNAPSSPGSRDASADPDAGLDDRDAGEPLDAEPSADAGPRFAHCPQLIPGEPGPAWIMTSTLGYVARCIDHTLAIAPHQGALHLRYLPGPAPERSWAISPTPAVEAQVGSEADHAILCTDQVKVRIRPDCTLTIEDADGRIIAEDESFRLDDGVAILRRRTAESERFYGFGEKTGPTLDKRGRRMTFWNTDAYDPAYGGFPPDQDPLYASIPFFIGLVDQRAYGLFTDSPERVTMDMASSDPALYAIASESGSIDQWLVLGPRMGAVIEGWTALSGRTPLPPLWALGHHQSRWGYSPAARVEEIAAQYRARAIPADAIWLDIQHLDGFRTFTFDPIAFPDPAAMIARLDAQRFATVVIADPGIKIDPGYPIFDGGLAGGHFLLTPSGELFSGSAWPGDSAFPDFTRAATRAWWGDHAGGLSRIGVRGVWLDVNEPTTFPESGGGSTIPNEVPVDGDGSRATMARAHNIYALLQAQATFEGRLRAAPAQRPFVLSRAGYAGIQRWAALWTGDAPSTWRSLSDTLPMLLGLGLSGVPFVGSDIGGYSGGATPELYARWLALGASSPFCRAHVTSGVNDQEPWAFGPEVEVIGRTLLEERYRLLPYLYSLFDEAQRTGLPVLRPLVLEHQDDPASAEIADEAMLGPFLLIAPILQEGATTRTVYLPPGRWFEERSGAIWDGPTTITLATSLAARPTFVRAGAILPRGPRITSTRDPLQGPLQLDVYPAEEASSFVLYEDAGDGYGAYARTTYRLERTPTGARLSASREGGFATRARELAVRLWRADGEVQAVLLDGIPIPYARDPIERTLSVTLDDRASFVLDLAYDTAIEEPRPTTAVTFEVDVPAETPPGDAIFVASSAHAWAHLPLVRTGPTTAAGTIEFPRGEWFSYKLTRGTWETVEKWPDCAEADDRYAFGWRSTYRDRVFSWRDQCE